MFLQSGNLQHLDEQDILDPEFQQRLEDARTSLRQEIQRELKIKEAAERLKRAVTSRKSAADVEGQLKASNRKLEKLHWKLQEVNARSMAAERETATGILRLWRSVSTGWIPNIFGPFNTFHPKRWKMSLK